MLSAIWWPFCSGLIVLLLATSVWPCQLLDKVGHPLLVLWSEVFQRRSLAARLCEDTQLQLGVINLTKNMKSIKKTHNRFNSLRPSDTKWWHRFGSTLAQVLAWCLTAPSHYLNQCWLIISNVQWHSSEGNFTRGTPAIIHQNCLQIHNSIQISQGSMC